jgi:hypothetical protein
MKPFKVLILAALVFSAHACKTTDSVSHYQDAQVDLTQPVLPSEQKLPKKAKVRFKNLKDGQTIKQNFKVKFDVVGMTVKPAGQLVSGTGHHHLIINGSSVDRGVVIPADEQHIHFGKGQTEYDLNLKPGKYTLTLQFADGAHLSYGEQLSTMVHVTVK